MMRTSWGRGRALVLLLLAPASVAHAETRLSWTCTGADGAGGPVVELVYAGAEPVPCKAYVLREGGTRLIADYDVTRGQCERQVRQMLASLAARGLSCKEPAGATLSELEARARGDVTPAAAAPTVAAGQGDLYFAIVSRHQNEAAARAAARRLRAADRSARPVILSPRDPGGSWLLALAAYTDAETAAKAVQYARQSGLGPDAYFWNVPRAQVAEEMAGAE
jgi:hypothetical protein